MPPTKTKQLQRPCNLHSCCSGAFQVIVDEAHHTVASTYTTILEGLGLIEILPPEPAQADDDMPAQQQADSSSSFATSATSSANSLDSLDSDGASSSSSFDEGDASSSSSTTTSTTSDSATSSRADSPSNNTAQLPRPRIKVVPSKHQLLLGFTATPFRLKKKESRALYDVFMPTFVRSMPQMISEGYLCEVRVLECRQEGGEGGGGWGLLVRCCSCVTSSCDVRHCGVAVVEGACSAYLVHLIFS